MEERVAECLMSWGRLFQMWGPLVSPSEDGAIIPFKVVPIVLSLKTNHGPSI